MHTIDGVDYFSVQEAADTLEITDGRVRQLISEELLVRTKMGNTSYVTVASVFQYKETRGSAGWPKGKPRSKQPTSAD